MATLLTLEILPEELAICRLPPDAPLPAWAQSQRPYTATRTEDELSVVCPVSSVPAGVEAVGGWRCLRVKGPFPFELTGVMSSLAGPLAEAAIPIFAFSTFDTDYVLVQATRLAAAVAALRQAGHTVRDDRATPTGAPS